MSSFSNFSLHREMVGQRLRSEGAQEDEHRTGSQRRASGPARRSFLKKKKKKHQHNNSKDSEGGSITDVPIHNGKESQTIDLNYLVAIIYSMFGSVTFHIANWLVIKHGFYCMYV